MRTRIAIAFCAAILAGCAASPPHRDSAPSASVPAAPVQAPEKKLAIIKGGGYYLDDGPGDNPPPNIDDIPDAVPKNDPLIEACNRPYRAMGKY